MNRDEIIRKMRDTGFAPEEYWIQTGAALVMRGVRENTHDIDIGCTHALIEKLAARSCPYEDMPDGHRKYAVDGDIEASEEWGRGEVSLIDGKRISGTLSASGPFWNNRVDTNAAPYSDAAFL